MFEFLLSDSYVNVGLLVVCCQMKFYAKINISYPVSLLIHASLDLAIYICGSITS